MVHWRTVGTTLAISALLTFAALGGGFHWRLANALAGSLG
jgi:hypothetical protein